MSFWRSHSSMSAVGVPDREVAGVKPAIAERPTGGLGLVEVALHDVVAVHHHFAHGLPVLRHVLRLFVDHAQEVGGAVGLTLTEIERLTQLPSQNVRKCSRRDLAIAIALGEDAATTVAGTMIVARMAGICIFATGGVGGVHRGQPFDVSADLIELGRNPVAVVCSGANSILDLPLTLELLETHGKRVTPFLLNRVAELTGGCSREANLALLINNAGVAGKIACELSALQAL